MTTFCEATGTSEFAYKRARERLAEQRRLLALETAVLPALPKSKLWQGLYGGNEAYMKRVYSPFERMIILEELTARAYSQALAPPSPERRPLSRLPLPKLEGGTPIKPAPGGIDLTPKTEG